MMNGTKASGAISGRRRARSSASVRSGWGVAQLVERAAAPLGGGEFWDGHSVYNTCIVRLGGKFYLFHIDDHFEWFQGDRYYAIMKDHADGG